MEKIKKFEREIILAFVLGFVVSSLFAFWGDLRETLGNIKEFSLHLIPLVLILTCLNYLLRFIRWHYFLGKVGFKKKVGIKKSAMVFFSGLPLTLTPGKTGEVLKAYFLKRLTGDQLARTIPVVITERLTDGLGALILLAFGFFSHPQGWVVLLLAFVMCFVFIFLVYQEFFWVFVEKTFGRYANRFSILEKIVLKMYRFRKVMLKLVGWKSLVAASLLAALAWFLEAVGFAIIISGVTGLSFNIALLSIAVFIFCFVSIIGFVSFLPGGLGVAEGGFIGMLIYLLSLSKSQAVASTILLRLLTLWWGVGIGLIAFFIVLKKLSKK